MAPARKHSGPQTHLITSGAIRALVYSVNGRVDHTLLLVPESYKADSEEYFRMLRDNGVTVQEVG